MNKEKRNYKQGDLPRLFYVTVRALEDACEVIERANIADEDFNINFAESKATGHLMSYFLNNAESKVDSDNTYLGV